MTTAFAPVLVRTTSANLFAQVRLRVWASCADVWVGCVPRAPVRTDRGRPSSEARLGQKGKSRAVTTR